MFPGAIFCVLSLAFFPDGAAADESGPPSRTPWLRGLEEGFVDGDGVKLHYVARGRGKLVLLLHGFPDFWYSWRHQIPALADHFRVVALDLRGYNKSDKPAGIEHYRMERLVADVAAVIRRLGSGKAVLVGHDWGGAIAWFTAMSHPELVSRLVTCNMPHPRGLLRELRTNPEQRKNSAYAREFQKEGAVSRLTPEGLASILGKLEPEERSRYIEAFRRSSFEAMLAYYKANYPRPPYDEPLSLPPVRCPVLIFHGLEDRALLASALNGTWEWVENELTIITVPEAGHWVHWDASGLVTRRMVSWLTEGDAGKRSATGRK